MGKLKDKLSSIVLLVICIVFCKTCTSDYLKGGDNKAISNFEKMIFDNSVVDAQLYPDYKEVTIKVLKIPIKTFEFRYHFLLNGTNYEGQHTFQSKLPESEKLKVYYLKSDPNFNAVDPAELLKSEKEKNSSKKDLYWGIGWGVLGLLSLITLFNKEEKG